MFLKKILQKRLFGRPSPPPAEQGIRSNQAPKPTSDTPQRKTLIVHIGDHKTGSTSIQLAFAKKQVELDGAAVFYPARLAMNALAEKCMDYVNDKTPNKQKRAAQHLSGLADKIASSSAEFTLLSGEAFETVPAKTLHQVLEDFFAPVVDDIRIIAYVRPHAARLTSSYAERTKIGVKTVLGSSLGAFVTQHSKSRSFHYTDRFASWAAQFPERFVLRPMIRSELHNGSVVEDFLHHAFPDHAYRLSPDSQANESLCLEDLMRLKVLQQHLLAHTNNDLRLKVGWEISRLLDQMPPPAHRTKLKLDRALARDIQACYQKDAQAMDQQFFSGKPLLQQELSKAVDSALELPQSHEPADHLSPEELRSLEMMSKFAAGLLNHNNVDWASVLHRKRLQDVNHAAPQNTSSHSGTIS